MDLPYTMSLCSENVPVSSAPFVYCFNGGSELARVRFNKYKAVKVWLGFLLVRVASMPPKHGHLGLGYGNKRCQN